MNVAAPIVQTLTTIEAPEAAAEAVPEVDAAPPAATSEAASAAAPRPPARDPNLDLARKFESAAQKESRARKYEREAAAKLEGLTAREKKLAEREAELDEALGDPVGHMLKNGTDPVKVAERYAKPESQEEKRIRKLEESLAQRDAADAARKERWEADRQAEKKYETLKGFVGAITSAECPHLTALYEANEVPGLIEGLLNRPADPNDSGGQSMLEAFREQRGRDPSDVEIREVLEYEAGVRATKILEAQRIRERASVATSPESQKQDSSKNEGGSNGISNQHAASSVTAKKPLSLEEKRKKMRKDLAAALEAETGDD